jgi:hypothetical protein
MLNSFKYLMQYIKILSEKSYNDEELIKIFKFMISIDNYELNEYVKNKNIFTYSNDLDVYYDTAQTLLKILEEIERYEDCHELMKKINQCRLIKLKKQI